MRISATPNPILNPNNHIDARTETSSARRNTSIAASIILPLAACLFTGSYSSEGHAGLEASNDAADVIAYSGGWSSAAYLSAPSPTKAVVNGVEFAWSSAGPVSGMTCVKILEPAGPPTWNDNFFCATRDIGMKWSSAGPIAGMKCTQILETADPHTWDDNYLCLPKSSRFQFRWSSSKALGDNSVQWLETADRRTWRDNFLQIDYTPGDVCAGTLYPNNTVAQAKCPQVCTAAGLHFGGNWTNARRNVKAASCEAGKESVCGCALCPPGIQDHDGDGVCDAPVCSEDTDHKTLVKRYRQTDLSTTEAKTIRKKLAGGYSYNETCSAPYSSCDSNAECDGDRFCSTYHWCHDRKYLCDNPGFLRPGERRLICN